MEVASTAKCDGKPFQIINFCLPSLRPTQADKVLHAQYRRQSGTVNLAAGICKAVDPPGGIGVCNALPELRGEEPLLNPIPGYQ